MSTTSPIRKVISITGATGFVGRRLADRHLALGDYVRILTRREEASCDSRHNLEVHCGDLNGDPDTLKRFAAGAEVLYHCAAELRDADRMHLVNVAGTRNLAEAASGRIGRWVQLSSVAIYGRQPAGFVTETTPAEESRPYPTTSTKLAAERIVREHAEKGAFDFSILRPCKIYGAGMPDASLRNLAAYIERGLFVFIGRKGASANYVHVDNVVEALLLCATHDAARNQAFNLCDGFAMEDLVAAMARILGKRRPRMRIPEWVARAISAAARRIMNGFPLNEERIDGLNSRAIYVSDAIVQQLGYRPVVSLEEGIRELMKTTMPMKAGG